MVLNSLNFHLSRCSPSIHVRQTVEEKWQDYPDFTKSSANMNNLLKLNVLLALPLPPAGPNPTNCSQQCIFWQYILLHSKWLWNTVLNSVSCCRKIPLMLPFPVLFSRLRHYLSFADPHSNRGREEEECLIFLHIVMLKYDWMVYYPEVFQELLHTISQNLLYLLLINVW